ncbi:MAG: hypothetical protein Q9186_003860 [Xanthomendoza sp. 1 TL-2023]
MSRLEQFLSRLEKISDSSEGDIITQNYVERLLKQNIESNALESQASKKHRSIIKRRPTPSTVIGPRKVKFLALDWETDSVHSLPAVLNDSKETKEFKIDAVIACDCVYNESLVAPFVRTCADLCQIAEAESSVNPTICIIAQQLRSPDVFEAWLATSMESFRVWRIPDSLLGKGLEANSGFVVHCGVLSSRFFEGP